MIIIEIIFILGFFASLYFFYRLAKRGVQILLGSGLTGLLLTLIQGIKKYYGYGVQETHVQPEEATYEQVVQAEDEYFQLLYHGHTGPSAYYDGFTPGAGPTG